MTHHRLLIGGTTYDLPADVDLDRLRAALAAAARKGAEFVALPVRGWRGVTRDVAALVTPGLPILLETITTENENEAEQQREPVRAGASAGPEALISSDDWLDAL